MQEHISTASPLSCSPPLTSDLWALGMLLVFLFCGATLFTPALYVPLATHGLALPTAAPARIRRSNGAAEYTREDQYSTSSGFGRIFASVMHRSGATQRKPAPPPPERDAELISAPRQQLQGRVSAHAAKMEERQDMFDRRTSVIKPEFSAQEKRAAEDADSVEELVDAQVRLLRKAGASVGAHRCLPAASGAASDPAAGSLRGATFRAASLCNSHHSAPTLQSTVNPCAEYCDLLCRVL